MILQFLNPIHNGIQKPQTVQALLRLRQKSSTDVPTRFSATFTAKTSTIPMYASTPNPHRQSIQGSWIETTKSCVCCLATITTALSSSDSNWKSWDSISKPFQEWPIRGLDSSSIFLNSPGITPARTISWFSRTANNRRFLHSCTKDGNAILSRFKPMPHKTFTTRK